MSTSMCVGVIGVGPIGIRHLAAWRQEGMTVVLLDTPSGRARQLGSQHGAAVMSSLDDVIAAVDIVDVCVPTASHEAIAVAALAARRHVICEKPIALSTNAAQRMIDAADRAGGRLFVAHVGRYVEPYAAAQTAIAGGQIGQPKRMALTRRIDRAGLTADHWIFDVARSGGFVVDVLIHDFDFARWILGDVVLVEAQSNTFRGAGGPSDTYEVTLTHASGAVSHISGALDVGRSSFSSSFEIYGDSGQIDYDSVNEHGDPIDDPFRVELREFAKAIEDGTKPRVSVDDAIAALRIALAAVRSQGSGLPVDPSSV